MCLFLNVLLNLVRETRKTLFCVSLNFLHMGATVDNSASVRAHTIPIASHCLWRWRGAKHRWGNGGHPLPPWCGQRKKAKEEAKIVVFSATSLLRKVKEKITVLNHVFRNTVVNSI